MKQRKIIWKVRKSSVEEVDKSEKDANKNETSSLPVTSDERALKTEVEHESKSKSYSGYTRRRCASVGNWSKRENDITKVTANKQEEESSTVAAVTTELTIDKERLCTNCRTKTHTWQGGGQKKRKVVMEMKSHHWNQLPAVNFKLVDRGYLI